MKKGFTMLELVFVIVILGIVSSIGSEVIVNVYQQYILQRAEYRASTKTELVSLQLANRIQNFIPRTIFRVNSSGDKETFEGSQLSDGESYIGIQWVAISSETKDNGIWSGFCDVESSSKNNISSPGSSLSSINSILSNLGTSISSSYIYFPYGFRYSISSVSNQNISIPDIPSGGEIYEEYKIAHTSYAVIVENGDLYLYYNFPPIPASDYSSASKTLLLKNVESFKINYSLGGTLRFKICKSEKISENFEITSCKEKAVY